MDDWNKRRNKPVETEQKPDSLPIQESNGTNPEVEKAKEELKYHLQITQYFDYKAAVEDFKIAAQNLLNAMDEFRAGSNWSWQLDFMTKEEAQAKFNEWLSSRS